MTSKAERTFVVTAFMKQEQKKRITQGELAARLQVMGVMLERDSISRIEIGTRFVADYEVVEIAKVLEVSTMWLLGLE